MPREVLRSLLTGGDRRSIAESNIARALVEKNPSLVAELAELTEHLDWLVAQRAFDLLEKIARDHPEWVEPHKRVFIAPLIHDEWEIRLQIVRAVALFSWSAEDLRRVKA